MNTEALDDQQLVDNIRRGAPVHQSLIDEYYRRCIPIYLDFIGVYWHTGFYLDDGQDISPDDQERMIRVIAASIKLTSQDQVLDIGCGIGSTACFLAQHYACSVRGLTPVHDQIVIAEQVTMQSRTGRLVSFDQGHAAQLPYPNNSVDVVLFFESPCHFPERSLFFQEAHRVLKPGGRLAGEDWLATINPREADHFKEHIQSICRDWAIPMLDNGLSYQSMMQFAGFENIHYTDMRSEMPLHKGFAVSREQQDALFEEITHCPNPLLKMTLEGLLTLGKAISSKAFTIGRFSAVKPD